MAIVHRGPQRVVDAGGETAPPRSGGRVDMIIVGSSDSNLVRHALQGVRAAHASRLESGRASRPLLDFVATSVGMMVASIVELLRKKGLMLGTLVIFDHGEPGGIAVGDSLIGDPRSQGKVRPAYSGGPFAELLPLLPYMDAETCVVLAGCQVAKGHAGVALLAALSRVFPGSFKAPVSTQFTRGTEKDFEVEGSEIECFSGSCSLRSRTAEDLALGLELFAKRQTKAARASADLLVASRHLSTYERARLLGDVFDRATVANAAEVARAFIVGTPGRALSAAAGFIEDMLLRRQTIPVSEDCPAGC